ncbi:ribosome assembly protein-like protein Noc2 [Tirmania nivea]|nr:ribosome assembly protein-like protein Noc2 [Tirmania nivea]
MGVKKSTKKFEKKKLGKVLDQRKAAAKSKQLHTLNEKRKKKRRVETVQDGSEEEGEEEVKEKKLSGDKVGIKAFEGMSVDDFLSGGFEVPEVKGKGKGKKGKKEEKGVGKKRKRTPDDDDDDDDEEEEEEEEVESDDEADAASADGAEESDGDDAVTGEFEKHKADIAALADADPEFYKYLQENDSELLNFDDLPGIDELSEGDSSEVEGAKKKKSKKQKKKNSDNSDEEEDEDEEKPKAEEVTKAHVKKWKKALAEENSLRTLRKVVLAFRAAVHLNDERDDSHQFKYSITNPDVYNDLMLLGLQQIPIVLNHHLPVKESSSGRVRLPTDTKKFSVLTPLIKSHLSSVLTLLPTLTDPATLKLLLTSCTSLLPYLLPFRKQLKSLLKAVVDIWSTFSTSGNVTTAKDDSVRITAFLVVRRAVVLGDEGIRETCFKALYAGLVRASRNTNVHTLASINLMKNSCAEILGLQGMEKVGYVVGFGSIRQLAVHLRNSITNKTKESYKTVYNWQYVHSLDFWSRALSNLCSVAHLANPTTSPYHPLIYPLVQVTLGAARLIPTAQYFPLRFQLIKCLLRLSSSTGTYIPLSPLIFEVFSSTALRKKAHGGKGSATKALDLETTLRCPPTHLKSRIYQTQCSDTAAMLLTESLSTWCMSPAFPELSTPVIVGLKRVIKRNESKNAQAIAPLKVLVGKIESNATMVETERGKWAAELEIAPARLGEDGVRMVSAKGGFEGFLKDKEEEKMPLGGYVASQRKIREERRKVLEEAVRAEGEKRRKGRKGGDDEEEEGREEEEEGRPLEGSEDEGVDVDDEEDELDEDVDEMDEESD